MTVTSREDFASHANNCDCAACSLTQSDVAELSHEVSGSLVAAINDAAFSHTRAGDGCWRDVVWIYHSDPSSPSGVKLAASGDKSVVEPLLRALRQTSPLSPMEHR